MGKKELSGYKCLQIMDKVLCSGVDNTSITIVWRETLLSLKDAFGVNKVLKGYGNIDSNSDTPLGIYIWGKENFLSSYEPDMVFMTEDKSIIGLYMCLEDEEDEILVCSECGSRDVEYMAWVDANTHKFKCEVDLSDEDNNFCNTCSSHVNLITEKEFKEQKEE